MNEQDFLNSIDCNFPYDDIEMWKNIIDTAISISNNCIFGIIYEFFNIPKNLQWKVKKKNIIFLLDYINKNITHHAIKNIINLWTNILNWNNISNMEVLDSMEKLKDDKWLYWALSILYFFWNDNNWEIENKYNEIINYWEKGT